MNELKISPEAKDDLAEIRGHIERELCNPQAALNLVSKIIKKIRGLLDHPEMGASLSSIVDIQTNYRFLVCANYLIFYRYEAEVIFVSRILYGRRDYLHILFGNLPEDEEIF
jgi:addiction module RelE/StbE family toxin